MLNAPLRPRTPDEDTPRDLAVRYKQKEVVELLGKLTILRKGGGRQGEKEREKEGEGGREAGREGE